PSNPWESAGNRFRVRRSASAHAWESTIMHTLHRFCLTLAMIVAVGIPICSAQTDETSTGVALGDEIRILATIVAREGDLLTVMLLTETTEVVELSRCSEIKEKKSNPFRHAQGYHAGQLVPGLAVEVEGRGDSDGTLVADKIRFPNDDFVMARTVDTR